MRKTVLLALLALVVISCSKESGEPRERLSLDGEWNFAIDSLNRGIQNNWFLMGLDNPISINVPHTWNVDSSFENYYGLAWYERNFFIPKHWKNKLVKIKFESVYHDALIWINGKKAGEHIGSGYTTFYIDISDFLMYGKSNLISVSVDNSASDRSIPFMNSFDWAKDGGIYGNVELIASGKPSVENILVHSAFSKTEDSNEGKITLEIKLDGNGLTDFKDIDFRVKVTEENQTSSNVVLAVSQIAKVENGKCLLRFDIPSVNLWHFDHPNLYKLEVEPLVDNEPTDRYLTTFGFRSFEIVNGNLYLNNEEVKITGVEWMPGSNPETGFVESRDYIERVLNDMKNANCIFTRFHWQQSEETIDLCNRIGLLVQEEIPLWQQPVDFTQPPISNAVELHAKEMIARDFNAPCIIAWGIGNELSSTNDKTIESLLSLKELVKSLDSSRIISYVSNHVGEMPEKEASKHFDWIMMNDYYGSWFGKDAEAAGVVLDEVHRLFPEKPIIISEWGLCEPRFEGGDPRRVRDMADHYAVYKSRPFVKAYIYFNYNDYRTHMGEEGEGRMRRRVHGVTDLYLNHKPSYQKLKQISSPLELIDYEIKSDSFLIHFRNKNTLPSYQISGYRAELYQIPGDSLLSTTVINEMQPGEKRTLTFPCTSSSKYRVDIVRGTENNVLSEILQMPE